MKIEEDPVCPVLFGFLDSYVSTRHEPGVFLWAHVACHPALSRLHGAEARHALFEIFNYINRQGTLSIRNW